MLRILSIITQPSLHDFIYTTVFTQRSLHNFLYTTLLTQLSVHNKISNITTLTQGITVVVPFLFVRVWSKSREEEEGV